MSRSAPARLLQRKARRKRAYDTSGTLESGLMLQRLIVFALIAAAAGGGLVFWREGGFAQRVQLIEARKGDAAEVVYATGIVEPERWAKVIALTRKRIVDVCRCEGKSVKAGDVLARLDDSQEQSLLAELEARRKRLQADVDRITGLVQRNIAPQTQLEQTVTQLREFEARIDLAKERIDELSLRAPMDGVVLRRDGEIGEIANTGTTDVLFWVGQPRPLRIVADVNEEDIPRVRLGQRVLLRSEGFRGKTLDASVAEITPKGDPQTKTFRVYLALPDNTPLLIGMSVEANIVTQEKKDVLLLPAEAILQNAVFTVVDGRLKRVNVETGLRGSRMVEITGGVSEGARVVSPATTQMRNGQRVRVETGEAAVMNLVVSIALTHIRARMRQTLVGLIGVAMGVGFSVMMAALMEGSQRDFVAQLVDAMPHISVTDQRREPPPQPAEEVFDLAQIHGLTTPVIRPGIKNPYALIASIESWVPGAVAPSVQSKAVHALCGTRHGGEHHRHRSEARAERIEAGLADRLGLLDDLYKSSNAIILGDGLAKKIGARVGNSVALRRRQRPHDLRQRGRAARARASTSSTKTRPTRSSRRRRSSPGQTGLVNEIRVRTRDVMSAREVAERIEAETRYKSVSWLEANEDLLSAFQIRNFIMFTVVGAILLVASFGTYNIISTITHEKTRDIAIMKSLGLPSRTVRRIFVLEAMIIGVAGRVGGLGSRLRACRWAWDDGVQVAVHGRDAAADPLFAAALRSRRRRRARRVRHRRLLARAQGSRACSRSRSSAARHERVRPSIPAREAHLSGRCSRPAL